MMNLKKDQKVKIRIENREIPGTISEVFKERRRCDVKVDKGNPKTNPDGVILRGVSADLISAV